MHKGTTHLCIRENHLQIHSTMAMTKKIKEPIKEEAENSPSIRMLRSLFNCRNHKQVIDSRKKSKIVHIPCSGSLCSLKYADENSNCNVLHRAEPDATKPRLSTSGGKAQPSSNAVVLTSSSSSSSSSSVGRSFRGMQLRRLSGCYECHMIDPVSGMVREHSRACPCADCGEIFVKAESLELHQAIRHAVYELGPEDTSRNIVEIIFRSSWLKKQAPVCRIERILKVYNTKKTVSKFEDYRDSIKSKASKLSKKHPRCVADGNELLRFYCTSFGCSLGLNGGTNLCDAILHCRVCGIIRDGIKADEEGRILTLATSGRAHDAVQITMESEKRAMLVCRVIAGRVKKNQDAFEEFDSVSGMTGVYSNLDELYVFNPKSILPCFVVIYRDA